MKIGLINTYSYSNVGDAAIYAALTKMLGDHEVYVALQNNDGTSPEGLRYKQDLSECDTYVSVGGDIFNNTRPWLFTRNFLYNVNQLRNSPETTFLFGQSIPTSCQGLSLKLLTEQLKRIASVTVRDQQSYQLLKRHGVKAKLSYDTAFVLECSEAAITFASNLLSSMSEQKCAVISLRDFNALYPADNEIFIRNIATLCQQLKQRQYQPILLIQSSVSELDSDWLVAKAIQDLCPGIKILDLVKYSSVFPSWELLQGVLKSAQLIVAVRYHTAVLALAAGRVPYNLYYSNKGADLCHRLKIPGESVEQLNPEQSIEIIEKTGQETFNVEPLRHAVLNDFKIGLEICCANLNKKYSYEVA